ITAVTGLIADYASKAAARAYLGPPHNPRRTLIPGFFDLLYAKNQGSAFSMLRGIPGVRWLFIIFACVAIGYIVYLVRRAADDRRQQLWLGFILAGAAGNAIDRVFDGEVTDFLLAHVHDHYWPVFNVADICLVVGVLGLLLLSKKPAR